MRVLMLWFDVMVRDSRLAVRTLARSPGFTAVALLTLMLGIGVNTAIFSAVNAVLLNPLPFPNSARLTLLFVRNAKVPRRSPSYLNFLDWRQQSKSFEFMAAIHPENFVLKSGGRAQRIPGAMVSADFFRALDVNAVAGRTFTAAEDSLDGVPVAMISDSLWQLRYQRSLSVLGTALELNQKPYVIVGVVPQSLDSLRAIMGAPEVYLPLGQWNDPAIRDRKVTTLLYVVGRRSPQATLTSASAEMIHVAANLAAAYPDANQDLGVSVTGLQHFLTENIRPVLLILVGGSALVLLVACTNISNLLLARSAGRRHEFSIRASLGAGRLRLAAHSLAESLLLSFTGGVAGVGFAFLAARAGRTLLPAALLLPPIAPDVRVLAFALVTALLAGIAFGLPPLFQLWRSDLQGTLRQGGRGTTRGTHRTQNVFVVLEICLAVALMVPAGTLVKALSALMKASPGFDKQRLLTFDFLPSPANATDPQRLRVLFRTLSDHLERLPGVDAASLLLDPLPLSGHGDVVPFRRADDAQLPDKDRPQALWYFVGPDYFRAMGIRLERGRVFTIHDDEKAPHVALIDEGVAKSIFPGVDPMGKRIRVEYTGESEIIGVVDHVDQWDLGGDPAGRVDKQIYFPAAQLDDKYLSLGTDSGATVVLRTRSEPMGFTESVLKQVEEVDPQQPAYNLRTMEQIVEQWLAGRRFAMVLLTSFSILAFVLAVIGTYGVIAYAVGSRSREFAIRLALGSTPQQITRLILADGGKLVIFGLISGIIAAYIASHVMRSLLAGIGGADAVTVVLVALLLSLTSLAACCQPAFQAARTDAKQALRE